MVGSLFAAGSARFEDAVLFEDAAPFDAAPFDTAATARNASEPGRPRIREFAVATMAGVER